MITIKTFPCNQLQENTYVVSDDTRECVIIDCGAYFEEEFQAIQNYIVYRNPTAETRSPVGYSWTLRS